MIDVEPVKQALTDNGATFRQRTVRCTVRFRHCSRLATPPVLVYIIQNLCKDTGHKICRSGGKFARTSRCKHFYLAHKLGKQ